MSEPDSSFDHDIRRYYDLGLEARRLENPYFRWERLRTLDLLDRFLPPAPAVIYDVGGGAGAYAFPLAEKGYAVHLVDPVPLHIEQAAKAAAGKSAALRSMQVGDARRIPADDGAADAVLFFGPLYHLTDRNDRIASIREARRVLKAGGILMAAGISRFASAFDGMRRDMLKDPKFLSIVQQDLKDGQHRNTTGNPDYFTTAFFHHPDELKQEIFEGGFPQATLYAIEGPVWAPPPPESDESRLALMATMRVLETDSSLVGASAHFMAIATANQASLA